MGYEQTSWQPRMLKEHPMNLWYFSFWQNGEQWQKPTHLPEKRSTLKYYKMFYSLVIITESFPYTFLQPSYTYTKSHTSCFCNQLESTNQNTVYISMCVNVYQYTSWYIQSITISQYVSHITMYISPLRTIYVALWYRLGSWQTPMIHVI